MKDWVNDIIAVTRVLAEDRYEPDIQDRAGQSMLAALTGAPSPRLRYQLERLHELRSSPGRAAEPQVHQYLVPLYLLSRRIVNVAAIAVAGCTPQEFAELADDERQRHRATGIVAVAALSTLRLGTELWGELNGQAAGLAQPFGSVAWTTALDQLAARSAELHELMLAADHDRRHAWRGVDTADRILAEALAAAVVGGAADASGVPPDRWLFPFHIFCKLALSAAEDGLATIEDWIGIEFAPPPRSPEREIDLAVLVAGQAGHLHQGCQCKAGTDPRAVAFVPRGPCRQADHDLRNWLPGLAKSGGRGGRYAETLWGWLRRWLGGAGTSRAAAGGRARLRPNDVAGSVLVRCWLHMDRGYGGPSLLYDRILPEYCKNCTRPAHPVTTARPGEHASVDRIKCCDEPQRVYRSDFTERAGKRVIRPKLGLIVASEQGRAGYRSTQPLGRLWLCTSSGRYFLSSEYCPDCQTGTADGQHEQVSHGWVLLPLADAWQDLLSTRQPPPEPVLPDRAVSASKEDLMLLQQAFSAMGLEHARALRTAADAWNVAREWKRDEMDQFMPIAGKEGLEALLRCKQVAEASSPEDGGEPQGGSNGDE